MKLLHHVTTIICLVSLQNLLFASACENDILSDTLISQTFSEDECLSQSSSSHCYKSIPKGSGLCYLKREERIIHKGEDCTFHLPIIYESRNITIPEAYLNQTFSESLVMNGTFPESALKHCQSINCYLVVHEQTSDTAYFMVEPKELNFEDSGIVFGESDKHYTMYFETRCEPTNPRGRTTVEEVCKDMGPPPENFVFAIENKKGTSLTQEGFDQVSECKEICETNTSCTEFFFLYQEKACTFWYVDDSTPNISSPICVSKPANNKIGVYHTRWYDYSLKNDAYFGTDDILSISGDVNACWPLCAKHPLCMGVVLSEGYCYLMKFIESYLASGNIKALEYSLTRKEIANGDYCVAGKVNRNTVIFNDDQEACESQSLCHKNFGTSEAPSPFCYAHDAQADQPVDFQNGRSPITQLLKWINASMNDTVIESFFPNKLIHANPSNYDCLKFCSQSSCFAMAFEESAPPSERCKLAMKPFHYPGDSDDVQTTVLVTFVKHGSDLEELCQDQGPLPPNWRFGKALFRRYQEVSASNVMECKDHCIATGGCPKLVIHRSSSSSCLVFETDEIFDPDFEAAPSLRSSISQELCIVEPPIGLKVRPTATRVFLEGDRKAPKNSRETIVLTGAENLWSNDVNTCWDYCQKLLWCQAVAINTQMLTCHFYEREEDLLRVADDDEEVPMELIVMSGKKLVDEPICDQGGIVNSVVFQLQNPSTSRCELFHLCHRNSNTEEPQKSFCYSGRDTPPKSIKITPDCEAQPFFTSEPGFSKFCRTLQNAYTSRPEGNPSYEACLKICSTDKNCYGIVYYPTTQECNTIANNASWVTTTRSNAIETRINDDEEDLECLVAFEVSFCEPCFERVQMEQQITYKDELQCTHTSQESCSDVYKTIFKTQEVEECKESFVKNCHIEYEMVPTSEKVEICHSPLTRNCNEEGPETCSTEYETVCATTYHENEVTDDVVNCNTVKEEVCDSDNENCRMVPRQVCEVEQVTGKKLTPETDCHQESREVCGPEVCPIVPGDRICADEIKTFVREVPQEKCEISPKTVCNMIHKIVPKLEMNQECIEVPQEICQLVQVEAKKERIPVIKYFCPSFGSDS